MKANEAYRQLVEKLTALYGRREAESIGRIVFEDAFLIRDTNRPRVLSPEQLGTLDAYTRLLLQSEPVQYVLGEADFYGLKFKVSPAVLIPRPETEELVHWILEEHSGEELSMLDVGTGSGCIPVTLKKHRPGWNVEAMEISTAAIQIAGANAKRHEVEVSFRQIDLLNRAAWKAFGNYGLIVSNPPYISRQESAQIPENVVRYEPEQALFVEGDDPLLFYRHLFAFAQLHLSDGGWVYAELNEFNALECQQCLMEAGFGKVGLKTDLSGKPRMLRGQWLPDSKKKRPSTLPVPD